jgi:hypothetical protein
MIEPGRSPGSLVVQTMLWVVVIGTEIVAVLALVQELVIAGLPALVLIVKVLPPLIVSEAVVSLNVNVPSVTGTSIVIVVGFVFTVDGKFAVASIALGTVAGLQFAAVFQFPLPVNAQSVENTSAGFKHSKEAYKTCLAFIKNP